LDFDFLDDFASPLVEALVATGHVGGWASDFGHENWLKESGLRLDLASVHDSSGGWDDLTSTSMDRIVVKLGVHDVESAVSHLLITEDTFVGDILESTGERVLDISEILDTLGGITDDIGSATDWSVVPDLGSDILVITEVIDEILDVGFVVQSRVRSAFSIKNSFTKLNREWLSCGPKSVLLVGGLGKAGHAGWLSDGFVVRDDWIVDDDFDTLGVEFSEILKTDLDVKITTTGDNVLSGGLILGDNDQWVRLGKLSETFDELGKIGWHLGMNSDSDDWRDGVLHHSDVMGIFHVIVDNGGLLLDDVINTDEGAGITAWNILDWLFFSAHHEDGSLDTLNVHVVLLSWFVLTTLDSDSHTGSDGTGEDSTEGSKPGEIFGWEHLGDEHAKFTIRLTGGDMLSDHISLGTFIKVLDSVFLGSSWGWELQHDHLKDRLGGVQPLLHDGFSELSTLLQLPLFFGKVDFKLRAKLLNLAKLTFEDGVGQLDDWLKDELAEGSLSWLLLLVVLFGGEDLLLLVVEPISPHHASEFFHFHAHSIGVFLGELGDSETPLVETGTESDGTFVGLTKKLSHVWDIVLRDNDIDGVDNLGQFLIHGLGIVLKFSEVTIHLVTK
jgi:hypothetical protein